MAEELVELAAKDVFVLLGVPVPENLETVNKFQEQSETKDAENESLFTLDDDDKIHMNIVTDPSKVDVTPLEQLDYSSSDSLTKSEIDEKRWYNPALNTKLDKYDFDSLKEILESIKNTNPMETISSLFKLRSNKITDESYQNMFIILNGFEVLINILECNVEDCVKEALTVIHTMSKQYGAQRELCHLDAVNPLINILIFKKDIRILFLATDTLLSIAKLNRGRKLIRISGAIRILVQMMDISKYVFMTELNYLNDVDQTFVHMVISCSDILRLLCRSLKSQRDLWNAGFIKLLPRLLNTVHIELQISTMSLISECCRTRPDVVDQKMNTLFRVALIEQDLLPGIIKFMISSTTDLAAKSAETILSILDDDPIIYEILLKHKGMDIMYTALKKFSNEPRVVVSVVTVLWKSSLNPSCREAMEKGGVLTNLLIELSDYPFNDRVVGYAIATLSELWKCESLRGQLKRAAVPKYLELLLSSSHGHVLASVCNALSSASADPDCMKMIDECNGFRLIFVLLPSLDVDEFDKYEDFYEPETTIAAANCLAAIIENTPPTNNYLKGMFSALCDLADLLKHKNLDILAASCRLIEVVSTFDDNLKLMINAGLIENLAKLVSTEHTNLRANLCRAVGKCCKGRMTARNLGCENIIDQLFVYINSEHQIVRDNISLALSGLSEDPLNCVKIEAIGFLPFLKQAMESDNLEAASGAAKCLENVRKTCTAIGQYHECPLVKDK